MMRKIMLILLLAVMCLSAVCGCQPTPETPVVVGKNDGDNKVTSLFGETSETEGPYEAPESWKEDAPITSADLSVMIDAKITVPDVTKFPVVKVSAHVFTQEEADDIIANLSEGNELFPVTMTREDKVRYLLAAKARLAELKAIESPSEAELIFIAKYEQNIPLLEAEIAAMPEGATPAPFTTDFQPDSSTGAPVIRVSADLSGGNLAYITIRNGSDGAQNGWSQPSSSVTFSNRESHMYYTLDYEKREVTKEDAIPNGTSITREEAITQAEDMMRKVGLTDMRLVLTMPASFRPSTTADTTNQCWLLQYYPVVNGIPVTMIKYNALPEASWESHPGDDSEYSAIFNSPAVLFYIYDTGTWMEWDRPFDILDTLNENAFYSHLTKFRSGSSSSSLLRTRRRKHHRGTCHTRRAELYARAHQGYAGRLYAVTRLGCDRLHR
jgi:hypothetical protein